MGEIVNLRKVRKARARDQDAAKAAENRARHGRTAAERERDRMEQGQADRRLDGARKDEHPSPSLLPLPPGEGRGEG